MSYEDGYASNPGPIPKTKPAFVGEDGIFHCPCGCTHDRGPLDPLSKVYRCLGCGKAYKVEGTVELR